MNKNLKIYVDGSFREDLGVATGAFVAIENDVEIFSRGFKVDHEGSRNVAGEVKAAAFAIKWAWENRYRNITIHHDYLGIANWAEGSWKANKPLTQKYVSFVRKYKEGGMIISFKHVKGHSGNKWNDRADELCSEAYSN